MNESGMIVEELEKALEEEIIKKYILIKQGSDLQCNTFAQVVAAEYMKTYSLNEHIRSIIKVYRVRRDLMIDSIKERFLKDVKYTYPSGGLFTWIELLWKMQLMYLELLSFLMVVRKISLD